MGYELKQTKNPGMAEGNRRVPWALHFPLRFLEKNLKNVLTNCWFVGIITNNETTHFDNTRRSGDQGENHQGNGSSRSVDDDRDVKNRGAFLFGDIRPI